MDALPGVMVRCKESLEPILDSSVPQRAFPAVLVSRPRLFVDPFWTPRDPGPARELRGRALNGWPAPAQPWHLGILVSGRLLAPAPGSLAAFSPVWYHDDLLALASWFLQLFELRSLLCSALIASVALLTSRAHTSAAFGKIEPSTLLLAATSSV